MRDPTIDIGAIAVVVMVGTAALCAFMEDPVLPAIVFTMSALVFLACVMLPRE